MKSNHGSLPNSSPTPFRAGAAILADDVSTAADMINWRRMPEITEFEATGGAYCGVGPKYGRADGEVWPKYGIRSYFG